MCETSSHGKRPADFDGDLYLDRRYQDSQGRFIFPKRCRVEKCGFPLLDQHKDNPANEINSQTYLLLMDAIRRSTLKLPNFETLMKQSEQKICDLKESFVSNADCTKVCGNLPPLVGMELMSEKAGFNSERQTYNYIPVVEAQQEDVEDPISEEVSISDKLGDNDDNTYVEYEEDADEREYQARKIAKKRTLTIEFWDRTEECRQAKWDHMEEMDAKHPSREKYILSIEHWVLWSRRELSHYEVEDCVYDWITQHLPHVVDDSHRKQ